MQKKNKGFTLMEMLIVIAIIAVLVAVAIPIFQNYLEKSRESTDLANVRSAYAEVAAEAMLNDSGEASKTVDLKQKQNDWQSADTVTIAGITHSNGEGDTDNWKGNPVAGGQCEVSYTMEYGPVFNWRGGKNTSFSLKEDLHAPLNNSGVFADLKKSYPNGANLEIDSFCPDSNMVKKVEAQMPEDSLLRKGSWAYLGASFEEKTDNRYLLWTSVNVNEVGKGQKIPIIVSAADGGFYVSESTTALRVDSKRGDYVAISDHVNLNNYKKTFIGDRKKYSTLEEAYAAYEKCVAESYPTYKNTLPQ